MLFLKEKISTLEIIEIKVQFLKSRKCSQGKVKKKILRENKKK